MTYAARGTKASHLRTRDKTLRTCGCGMAFETVADDPPEACPACTWERNARNQREWRMRRAEKIAEAHKDWELIFDPSEYPLVKGMRLSKMEVDTGILFGSWLVGTRFKCANTVYVLQLTGLEEIPNPRK